MAKCNFSISYTQSIEGLIQQARNGVAEKGGTFSGDTHSGSFSIPTKLGDIKGTYAVRAASIDFEITDKPWLVVTCNRIQSELEKLINGSNDALSFELDSEEKVGSAGETYEVGSIEEEGLTPFDVTVNWQVGSAGTWVETSKDIREKTGIVRYCLCKQDDPSASYQYILYFVNEKHYKYYFYDQESSRPYKVNTFRNAQHWVRYDSKQPTIIRITGS